MDNIAENSGAVSDSVTPGPVIKPDGYLNIMQAKIAIIKRFDRSFKQLLFLPPLQMVDGSVASFIDGEMKVTLATCRIRLRNQMVINRETGDITIEAGLSDLTFNASYVNVADMYSKI